MSIAWKDEGISQTEKIVLLALCDCANDEGMCFPSVSRLEKKCCLSDRGVQKAMAALEKRGFVSRDVRSGKSSIYWVTPELRSPPNVVHPERGSPTPERRSPPPPNVVHPTPEPRSPINITEQSGEPSLKRKKRNAREENNEHVDTTAGSDGPPNADQAQPGRKANKRATMRLISVDQWTGPGLRCLDLIERAGIPREFADSLLVEFRFFWEERGEVRPGWDATFLNHVKIKWERKPPSHNAPIFNQRGNYAGSSGARKFNAHQYVSEWIRSETATGGEEDFSGAVADVRAEVDGSVTDRGNGP